MHELSRGESRSVTLRFAWGSYKTTRPMGEKTIAHYEQIFRVHLGDWLDVPLELINKQLVLNKYQELTGKFSGTTTNKILRIAKAVIDYAIALYDLPIKQNPVSILSHLRLWHKNKSRTDYIPDDKMAQWYEAVEDHRRRVVRDYLKFLMLTGLRRNEAACLKWQNVDLDRGTFSIYKTKNGKDLHLPMATYTWQLLRLRREANPYDVLVFSGTTKKPFHIHYTHLSPVQWACGVRFTPHGMRRTFLTVGESLDIPLHILKQLCNHRQPNDVTLQYIQLNTNRLRKPIERIAERMLELWTANTH